jgi:hypothetical protein
MHELGRHLEEIASGGRHGSDDRTSQRCTKNEATKQSTVDGSSRNLGDGVEALKRSPEWH